MFLKSDELFCVACDKSFKNKKAKQNHETSKKHEDNINKLIAEMEAEEEGQISEADDVSEGAVISDKADSGAEDKSFKGEVNGEGFDAGKNELSDEEDSDSVLPGR